MDRIKSLLICVILALLTACEPPVTFTEPQPSNSDNLSKFPKRLHGEYLSLADSSLLVIGDNRIQRIYNIEKTVHLKEMDSNTKITGDSIIDLITKEGILIHRKGDSLTMHIELSDILFQLDHDHVVRKLKGNYFLNFRYDMNWEVKKLAFTDGQLAINSIESEQEIANLKEIAETPVDMATPYAFTLSRKQFKDFVKQDGFNDSEVFVRIKKNAQ